MTHTTDPSLLPASPWWRPDPGTPLMIRGGQPLIGTYPVSGAKNAVLPLMVSALLTPHLVTLHNVPASLDIAVLANLLHRLGVGLNWHRHQCPVADAVCRPYPTSAASTATSSAACGPRSYCSAPCLARCGEARLPMPGGDAIGLRGIDFHVAGLRAMGAAIDLSGGMIRATAPHGLRGADIALPQPSVGATENLLLAAVLATGETVIRNAAREPEIADLARCLIAMGASIDGIDSDTLIVEGGM